MTVFKDTSFKRYLILVSLQLTMSLKSKGINAERELIHMFWDKGWAAIRVAGSGSSIYPSPDVLAGNNLRKLAIECKSIKGVTRYLSKEEIANLEIFANKFGAEPWIGVRFDHLDWYFIGIHDLERTEKSVKITVRDSKMNGLLFEELIK